MPGTAFSTSNWSGYDEQSATNPSAALTDFTLLIDISTLSAEWKAAIQSDGGDIRVTKGDNTELPFDLIDFVYNAGAPTGHIRVKYSGTLASSGTQNVRVWAGYTGGTAVMYDAGETHGSDNAYDANWAGYWPQGAGADRTANGNDLTGTDITPGDSAGQVGAATDYAGTSSRADLAISFAEPATILGWVKLDTTPPSGTLAGWGDKDSPSNQHRCWYPGSSISTIRADSFDGTNSIAEKSITPDTDWHQWGGVWSSDSNRKAFYDGSPGAANTVTRAVAGEDRFTVGVTPDSTPSVFLIALVNDLQLHLIARADEWVAEEFAQANDQATFWGTWAWTEAVAGGGIVRQMLMQHG